MPLIVCSGDAHPASREALERPPPPNFSRRLFLRQRGRTALQQMILRRTRAQPLLNYAAKIGEFR
jgi:hypothetical protein